MPNQKSEDVKIEITEIERKIIEIRDRLLKVDLKTVKYGGEVELSISLLDDARLHLGRAYGERS